MRWLEGNRSLPGGGSAAVRIGVDGGRICELRDYPEAGDDLPDISPGFIDVHVHGGGGGDVMDATPEAFSAVCESHARHGTTTLLLTTVTQTPDRIGRVLDAVQGYMREEPSGARVAGVHLEGPFLHPERAGAQRPDLMIDPDADLAQRWFETGVVRWITMAPDRPGAQIVASMAARYGIVVAAGHTNVDAAGLGVAAAWGYSHVTHLCNAMRPVLHRAVGPVGHVVEDESFTGELICDGIHLEAAMVKLLVRGIGYERLLLITDAIRAADREPGLYDLGGLTVEVKDGACRLADGTLAGSVLTMDRACRLVQRFADVDRAKAEVMAAANPARRLGLARKGRIELGFDADLVAHDGGAEAVWTMVGGRMVHERGETI